MPSDEIPTERGASGDVGPVLSSGSRVTFRGGQFDEGIVFHPPRSVSPLERVFLAPHSTEAGVSFYLEGEEVSAETYFASTVTYVVEVRRGTGEIVSFRQLELFEK